MVFIGRLLLNGGGGDAAWDAWPGRAGQTAPFPTRGDSSCALQTRATTGRIVAQWGTRRVTKRLKSC